MSGANIIRDLVEGIDNKYAHVVKMNRWYNYWYRGTWVINMVKQQL